jgi:hypothetical protein
MASSADRRRAQRRNAQQVSSGNYRPSNIGRRARELAKNLRERQQPPPPVDQGPIFTSSTRTRVKEKKRQFWDGIESFSPRESDRVVDESNDFEEMADFLEEMDENTAVEFASNASKAWSLVDAMGDAGDLEIYLPYSFLFYH